MNLAMRLLIGCAFAACLGTQALAESAIEGLSPLQILLQARLMFPREQLTIRGRVGTAEQRGQHEKLFPYTLNLDWSGATPLAHCRLYALEGSGEAPLQEAEMTRVEGAPHLTLIASDGQRITQSRLNTPIAESDLTWMDLAFDYLWWQDLRRVPDAECHDRDIPQRVSGRAAAVIEARPPTPIAGLSAVRIWVDEATGNLLQTAQLDEAGAVARLMYVQKIGREEGRWVPREFRIKRTGSRRITRLTVTSIASESFSVEENADD